MRIISTWGHGILDYVVGPILIAAPWALNFPDRGAMTWTPVALGVAALVYSLMTEYEWGMVPILPMPVHLGLDALSGIFLAASPWLFGFAQELWVPHVALGLFEI